MIALFCKYEEITRKIERDYVSFVFIIFLAQFLKIISTEKETFQDGESDIFILASRKYNFCKNDQYPNLNLVRQYFSFLILLEKFQSIIQ